MKKNYFITGGTGSFGSKFAEMIIKKKLAKKIIIFSRDEFKQNEMKQLDFVKKNENIFRFFIGDVRDKSRLEYAITDKIDIIVHAAALKQVPATEYNPFEAVKTNIIGTQNIIETATLKNIRKVLCVSTDKAAAPINLYGSTKLTAERLFIAANNYKGSKKCMFSIARYGNVFGSRGSVVPLFLDQIKKKKQLTVTNSEMTRFDISLDNAIIFVLKCLNNMKGGEIFVPKLSSYRIRDLIKALDVKKFKLVGIRSGEKIHEELITSQERIRSLEKKDYYVILPSFKNQNFITKKNYSSYNSFSNSKFLSIKDLKLKIKKFIKN
jgi:UDP-N-acetylglucosamine 4,6-dehydratase